MNVGGLGASTTLFQFGREVLKRALDLIFDCGCNYAAGCPCCTLQARYDWVVTTKSIKWFLMSENTAEGAHITTKTSVGVGLRGCWS